MATKSQKAFDEFVQKYNLDLDDDYWPEWAKVEWETKILPTVS